jgi:hypothetical protein
MTAKITRNPVVVAVSFGAVFLCAWIVFIGSQNPPVDLHAVEETYTIPGISGTGVEQ